MTSKLFTQLCSRQLIALTAFSLINAHSALAAPPGNAPVKDFLVHHVRLTGTGLRKTVDDVFKVADSICRERGTPLAPPPPDGNYLQVVIDIYYAAGAATRHTRTKGYSLAAPESCTLRPDEQVAVEMRTASGVCMINPKRKRAVGDCDIQALLAGKTVPALGDLGIRATGETKTIAGHKCSVFKGKISQLNSELCIAQAGSFTGTPDSRHKGHPGLLLKTTAWADAQPDNKLYDFEATQVSTDIKVSLDVLAPHIAGGYTIIESAKEK